MTDNVAPEISERIRRPAPADACVLPGSLPVVAFGSLFGASVATLALNPSSAEFLSTSGAWLTGSDRRLASRVSLGVDDARDLDDSEVAQVLAESDAYFQGPNWYRRWFNWLDSILKRSGLGSYLDGSACHLDLVQWATHPVQRQVPARAWRRLVDADREFLCWQLRQENLRTVLVNGRACVDELRTAGVVRTWSEDCLTIMNTNGPGQLRVYRTDELGVRFVGWNRPVAGALSADGRLRLADWVAANVVA